MKIFLDTSSLIKLYHNEIGTDLLDKIKLASLINVKIGLSFAVTADDLLKSLIESEGINTK